MSAQIRNPRLLTVKQAAISLGVSVNTVRNWDKQGLISAIRTTGGQRRFAASHLAAFLKQKDEKFADFTAKPKIEPKINLDDIQIKRIIPPVFPKELYEAKTYQNQIIFSQKFYFASGFLSMLAVSAFVLGMLPHPSQTANFRPSPSHLKEAAVLAATSQRSKILGNVSFAVPAIFKENVKVINKDLDIGSGRLTAANIIYSLTGSDGISVTSDQTPTIKNTGVLSVNNKTGALTLEAGSGITISGLKISASDTAATFKTITIGSNSFSAGSSSDTLTFAEGTGITISADTSNKKLTVSASGSTLNVSGWTDDGTTVRLSTSTDNVGIGTASPTSKLSVGSNSEFQVNSSGAVAAATGITSSGTITLSGLSTAGPVITTAAGVLSSEAALAISRGGTGKSFSSLGVGDILYANTTTTFTNLTIGSTGKILQIVNGLPAWVTGGGGGGSGSVCTDCLINDPTDNTINVIAPTGAATTALSVKQTSTASPTSDIFNVTNSGATTKYLKVDSTGNVTAGNNTSGIALTIAPGSISATPSSSSGPGLTLSSFNFTDNNTSASGAINNQVFNSIAAPTLLASNSGIKTFHSSTLYIAGAPTASTNQTISNAYALNIASGTTALGGSVNLTSSSSTVVGTAVEGGWTLGSNTFNYRRTLTVTNPADGGPTLPAQYQNTVTLTSSTASQIFNNSRTDYNDLRIAWDNNGSITEISKQSGTVTFTSSTVAFTFQIQGSGIADGASATYYIYYGNAAITSAGSTYTAADTTLDAADDVTKWTSGDSTRYPLANEATIVATSSTGSIKQGATTAQSTQGDAGTFTTSGQGPAPSGGENHIVTALINGSRYAYLVGGALGTGVDKASVDSSGNIGTFSQTQTLPQAITLHTVNIVTIGSSTYMYVVGGYVSIGLDTVYRATISSADGSVGAFTQVATLPQARRLHATVILTVGSNTYMLVMGGEVTANNMTDTVYEASIDSSGNLGSFTTAQTLPETRDPVATGVVIGSTGYIYIIGGTNGSFTATTVYRATINSSGTVSTFTTTGQTQLPTAITNSSLSAAQIGSNWYLYSTGGTTSSVAINTVYKAGLDSSGNVTSFTATNQATLATARKTHTSSVITAADGRQYLYAAGSTTAAALTSIEKAQLLEYTATYTFASAQDLSVYGTIRFQFRSTLTGSYMAFEFSQDGNTWQTSNFSVSSANTFVAKTYDISGITAGSRNAVKYMRFRVTDQTTSFTAYFDTIQALVSTYISDNPSNTAGNPVLGAANISINAQGSGAVNLNYDSSNSLAGSGGLTVYNGGATPVFTVSGSGNVGIGTSVPNAKLSIQGNVGIGYTGANQVIPNNGLAISGNLGIGTTTVNSNLSVIGNGVFGADYGGVSAPTNGLAIEGNVGIGFTSPNQALQVASAPSAAISLANILGANGSQLSLTGNTASTTLTKLAIGMDTTNYFGYLQAGQNGSASNLALEPSGGNVGIGTTSPTALFHIQSSGAMPALLVTSGGNVGIGTSVTSNPLTVGTSGTNGNGAFLSTGGAWTNGSSIEFKENITPIDQLAILDKISVLPITQWNYKIEGPDVKHIGPLAEDFYSIFKVGSDNQHISTIDPSGVALAGIQALTAKVDSLNSKLETLEASTSAKTATSSAELLPPWSASSSAQLINQEKLTVDEGVFSESLKSLGKTILGATIIAGDLTVDGTLSVNGKGISTAGTLYLQNEPLAQSLDIFNGKFKVDKDGKLSIVKLEVSAQTVGEALLPAGKTEIKLENKQITENSKVFLTPLGPTNNQTLFVSKIEPAIGFSVAIENSVNSDIKFNWWIVEQRKDI